MGRPAAKRPPVVVVGSGRLGGALALALKEKRWPVRVLSRGEEGRRRTRELGLEPAEPSDLKRARLCLLCVPDGAVPHVARELGAALGRGAGLVHTAGALPLRALGSPKGRQLGSFHPLCAVSSAHDKLVGHTAAISTHSRTLRQLLEQVAKDVGLSVIKVPEAHRAAYHAGAVLSAGGVVSVIAAAVQALRSAGISEQDALAALLPLARSALRGVEARGLAGGLTGPIRRGDVGVVKSHLEALPPEVAAVYRPLGRSALALAAPHLSPEVRAELEHLL